MSKVRSFAWLSSARLLSAVLQVFVIRFIFDIVGAAAFGAFMYMQAISRIISILDLQYGEGAQREFVKHFESGNDREGFRAWVTLKWALIGTAVVLLLAHIVAGFFITFKEFDVPKGISFFVLASGFFLLSSQLYYGVNVYFIGRRKYGVLSITSALLSVITSVVGIAGLFLTRKIEGYIFGYALATLMIACLNIYLVEKDRKAAGAKDGPSLQLFKSFAALGLKGMPNRLLAVATSMGVPLVIKPIMGEKNLGMYSSAARFPEVAYDTLQFSSLILPELTSAFYKGQKEMGQAIRRYSLLSVGMTVTLVLIPTGFGLPVLQLWLGPSYSSPMEWVMVGIGLHRVFESMLSTLGFSMVAAGQPQRTLPFFLWDAIMTVILVPIGVIHYGIVGAIAAKVAIHVMQVIPFMLFARKTLSPELAFGSWLRDFFFTVFLGCGIAFGCFFLMTSGFGRSNPWIGFLALPAAMLLYGVLITRTKCVDLPESIRRRLPFLGKKVTAQ